MKPSPPVAWITGAGGLIGSYLAKASSHWPWTCRPLTRPQLDLTNFDALSALFRTDKPTRIIHCAALTKPALCQANRALAYLINVEVTRRLADLARDVSLIFLSTDVVFDGRRGSYVESDPVNPLNIYAETKVAAEQLLLANPRHTVIRTSLNGGRSPTGDRGFSDELKRAWREGRSTTLFTDEYRSPIHAKITAQAIWELAAAGHAGLYHLAGAERLSRYQIGQLLANLWPNLRPSFSPGSLLEYQGPPRAADTTLNSAKVQTLLSFPLPAFSDFVRTHSQDF